MTTRTVRTAALALVLACGGVVNADTFLSVGDGNWDSVNTWSQNGSSPASRKPQSGDVVTIVGGDANHTVTVTTTGEQVTTLTIEDGATLVINSAKDLSLAGTTPAVTFNGTMTDQGTFTVPASSTISVGSAAVIEINGGTFVTASNFSLAGGGEVFKLTGTNPAFTLNAVLTLSGAASEVLVEATATIGTSGSGRIEGTHDSAAISIKPAASAITCTSAVELRGLLDVEKHASAGAGAANFVHNGVLRADRAGGTMVIASGLGTVNGSGAVRLDTDSSAAMTFDVAASFSGNLIMDSDGGGAPSGGTLNLNANLTVNTFDYDNGSVVTSGAVLAWTNKAGSCVGSLNAPGSLNSTYNPCP